MYQRSILVRTDAPFEARRSYAVLAEHYEPLDSASLLTARIGIRFKKSEYALLPAGVFMDIDQMGVERRRCRFVVTEGQFLFELEWKVFHYGRRISGGRESIAFLQKNQSCIWEHKAVQLVKTPITYGDKGIRFGVSGKGHRAGMMPLGRLRQPDLQLIGERLHTAEKLPVHLRPERWDARRLPQRAVYFPKEFLVSVA